MLTNGAAKFFLPAACGDNVSCLALCVDPNRHLQECVQNAPVAHTRACMYCDRPVAKKATGEATVAGSERRHAAMLA